MTGGVGVLTFALLFVLRANASATGNSVTFAGRELHWECAIRQRFGVPCPSCGLTRSVLLTLHGHFASALDLNPAGPLILLGAVLLAASMLLLTFQPPERAGAPADGFLRRLVLCASAYGGLTMTVMLINWARVVF